MYHSIIISGRNTFDAWGLIPTSRPVVAPPKVKTTYVELPASNGVLDYTGMLQGSVPYGQREGSWEFALKPGSRWADVYSALLNYLHGRQHTVILEDDPKYQYTGRLEVNSWNSSKSYSLITVDYSLDSFKQSVEASNAGDWRWDELFDKTIRYGTFSVDGQKYRNLINGGVLPTTPIITCTAPMAVTYEGRSYSLVKGKNYNTNLMLQCGDNIMIFSGKGTVDVSYREESL